MKTTTNSDDGDPSFGDYRIQSNNKTVMKKGCLKSILLFFRFCVNVPRLTLSFVLGNQVLPSSFGLTEVIPLFIIIPRQNGEKSIPRLAVFSVILRLRDEVSEA